MADPEPEQGSLSPIYRILVRHADLHDPRAERNQIAFPGSHEIRLDPHGVSTDNLEIRRTLDTPVPCARWKDNDIPHHDVEVPSLPAAQQKGGRTAGSAGWFGVRPSSLNKWVSIDFGAG